MPQLFEQGDVRSNASYDTVKTNDWELEARKQDAIRKKAEFMASHSSPFESISRIFKLNQVKNKFMNAKKSAEKPKEAEPQVKVENRYSI